MNGSEWVGAPPEHPAPPDRAVWVVAIAGFFPYACDDEDPEHGPIPVDGGSCDFVSDSVRVMVDASNGTIHLHRQVDGSTGGS